jgi:dTDP-4-amino-4,6-dideoxygalactose transaminase
MPGFELWSDAERKEVNDVLETGILMRYGFDGPRKGQWKAKELEEAICAQFGSSFAQLTSSGTAALTTALAALGVGTGDEVIMPCFTFVASFEAVLSVGAIPVLVDVDDTLTLSPSAVRKALTPKTKCIMPVHMCGSMADMDALQEICRENNLLLLEDACQSIGGTYKGKHLGTIGDAGTFSFDFVKTITCGEGGVVLTNREDIHTKSDAYSEAAQFLLFERAHLMDGLKLADKAIELNKNNGGARRVKMEIYEYLGMYKEALNEITRALEMEKNKPYENEADRASEVTYWQTHQMRIKEQQGKR